MGFSAGRSVAYKTVLQQFFTVIGADNNEGVFQQSQSFQRLDRSFDLPVQQSQLAIIKGVHRLPIFRLKGHGSVLFNDHVLVNRGHHSLARGFILKHSRLEVGQKSIAVPMIAIVGQMGLQKLVEEEESTFAAVLFQPLCRMHCGDTVEAWPTKPCSSSSSP